MSKRYRYTGKERDEESGLYYHGARYYAPWLGRWTAVDPLESKYAGMSSYNYCANNPVKYIDSDGKVVTGFENLKINKNQFKNAINIISQSEVFMNYLSQFVSTKIGDNLDQNKEGSRSFLNLNFEIYSHNNLEEPSLANIEVFNGNEWESISSFKGNVNSKDISKIRINIALSAIDYMSTGEKTLTISHEIAVHAKTHAYMIEKFHNNEIEFKDLREYFNTIDDSQHLKIYNETNNLYENINDDIEKVLEQNFSLHVDNLGIENAKGYKAPQNSRNERLNKRGQVPWLQSFQSSRNEEKSTSYNPEKRSSPLSLLKD